MKVIVGNMLPLSLADSNEFRELMAFIEPNYKVPCRQTVTTHLNSMKAELARNVSSEMTDAAAVHMTTGIWGSITNIGVTATYVSSDWQLKTRRLTNAPMEERHTMANIASRLQETAASWAI